MTDKEKIIQVLEFRDKIFYQENEITENNQIADLYLAQNKIKNIVDLQKSFKIMIVKIRYKEKSYGLYLTKEIEVDSLWTTHKKKEHCEKVMNEIRVKDTHNGKPIERPIYSWNYISKL